MEKVIYAAFTLWIVVMLGLTIYLVWSDDVPSMHSQNTDHDSNGKTGPIRTQQPAPAYDGASGWRGDFIAERDNPSVERWLGTHGNTTPED